MVAGPGFEPADDILFIKFIVSHPATAVFDGGSSGDAAKQADDQGQKVVVCGQS
jgi:hypothetical protein